MDEKRGSKRLDISVQVELERIDTKDDVTMVKFIDVAVTNISKTGLAFRTKQQLKENALFNAKIQIWTKETIDTIFKIVRIGNTDENGLTEYGCIFVGMTDTDALKIEIYQLFNDVQ